FQLHLVNPVLIVIDELLFEIMSRHTYKQHSFYLSLSIGIAVYPFGGINTTTLLQHADIAMYSAKEKGNNPVLIVIDELLFEIMSRHTY
ncbi:diguanylate cyclase domain-containing protein, partial [Bacillus sp. D-CC]